MQNMQKVPASNQVLQLTDALTRKLVERLDAARRIEQLDEEISAIRNILAGVGIGQQVEAERAASAVAKKTEESAQNE